MEPITRKEKYLAAIVGQAVELPEPITREEMFLAEIASNGTGGGGGSGNPNAVLYTPQTLTPEQQKQARDNAGVNWENLPDKPFYKEQRFNIVWDGDMAGKVALDMSAMSDGLTLVKVSELVPIDEINGATLTMMAGAEANSVTMTDEYFDTEGYPGCVMLYSIYCIAVVDAEQAKVTMAYAGLSDDELAKITTGIWFIHIQDENLVTYVSSLVSPANIKKIPEDMVEHPASLPNPNALTFKGAFAGEYDGSQPIEVELIGSWNDLSGRPFYSVHSDTETTIKWDGTVDGRDSFMRDGKTYIKISDLTPSVEDISTGYYWYKIVKSEFSSLTVRKFDGAYMYGMITVVQQPLNEFNVPSTGMYVPALTDGGFVNTVVYYPLVYHPIDERFIPESIARKTDIGILTSPNGTRFRITVSDDGVLSATAV